jgi:hypothetical protein
MATVRIEAELSPEELLRAVEQLSASELEEFVQRVLVVRAQRRAPSLSQAETELLLRINQGVPAEVESRYSELIARRRAETLTPDEHRELLDLTETMEGRDVDRLEALVELAKLRRTSPRELMDALGIRPPNHV